MVRIKNGENWLYIDLEPIRETGNNREKQSFYPHKTGEIEKIDLTAKLDDNSKKVLH